MRQQRHSSSLQTKISMENKFFIQRVSKTHTRISDDFVETSSTWWKNSYKNNVHCAWLKFLANFKPFEV